MVGSFEVPSGWFQAPNALYILLFAPAFSALWIYLGRRNLDPSAPAKFALGLLLLGLGFLVMVAAASVVASGQLAEPQWLLLAYLLHTFGELCLSPVGLSSVTKLAPPRFVGQMMGLWFLATSFGLLLAGLIAGRFGLDAAQAPRARQFFDAINGGCAVDMSGLDYISSAGLGVLLSTHKRLMAVKSGLELVNGNPHIRDIFRYSGFDRLFVIRPA